MSKGLKLKSEGDFEKLLKHVADDLFHAKVHFTIFSEIGRLAKTRIDELNFSPVFWQYTFRGHAELALVRVFRIYDQHPSGFHLLRLLQTVESNEWLFAEQTFLSRMKHSEHAESLYRGIPDKNQLDADIHFVSESNPRISNLKRWRDEVFFHKDPRQLLSNRNLESESPLPYAEVADLIEEGTTLVNRYSSHFNAVHFGNDTRHWNDVDFVVEALTHHPFVKELREDEQLLKESNHSAPSDDNPI